jgi:hypothetical protein
LLQDIPDTSAIKNAIQLTRKDVNKTYIVQAENDKEKASWVRELELAIDDSQNSDSAKRVAKTQQQNSVRPIWKPDSTADHCFKCNGKFHLRRRKVGESGGEKNNNNEFVIMLLFFFCSIIVDIVETFSAIFVLISKIIYLLNLVTMNLKEFVLIVITRL